MVTLKSAIAAYSAAGGNRYVLAQWLIGQIRMPTGAWRRGPQQRHSYPPRPFP